MAPPTSCHLLSRAEAARRLASAPEGLAEDEAAARRAQYGANALPEPPRRSLFLVVVSQLGSPLIYLLLAAAVVSVALGELKDAAFIVLVLAINTTVGAVQEARAEAQTAALRKAIRTRTRTLRDGRPRLVDSADLVPGDVVLLEAGDRVPADLRLLVATELQAAEAALTGESVPVDKTAGEALADPTPLAERTNMLFAGTTVVAGQARALVAATGRATELGRIARALDEPATVPPLSRRLDRFARVLGVVTLAVIAALVVVRLALGAPPQETFMVAVALAVSVIPEGLPVAVTVALSIATRRMARRRVIVRHLPAVEGLGACTVIATDKTGTLTVNQLTATQVYLPRFGTLAVHREGEPPVFRKDGVAPPPEALAALVDLAASGALCNDASLDPVTGLKGASGDTVDIAFLVLAAKAGLDGAELRARDGRMMHLPFAAERRFAASLNQGDGGPVLHVKGAAETVLPLCADAGGALAAAESMAREGHRVLAVARRRLDHGAVPRRLDDWLGAMELLGLVGFIDPLRPEAREAVAACRRAGVKVKMITGDHGATALFIARELGIAERPGDVMTGRDLAALADRPEEARRRILQASVFARVEPSQKLEIVDALQAAGEVVAMTGDGVNDVPALRRADLGVAMGRDGTDVARDSADLVLADDNFASVVAAVEEGRAAYANIRKIIYLLISTGAAEVVLFLLAVIANQPVPLTTVQLLWLNLVTNGGQDVALAFEGKEPGLLERPPRSPGEAIFDPLMVRQTVVSGLYMGALAYGVFAVLLAWGWSAFDARNALLFLMVAFENVQVFNARSETRSAFAVPLSANWPLVATVAATQAAQIGAAYVPGLAEVLQVAPISFGAWATLVPVALSLLLVVELEKGLRRRAARRSLPA